MISGPVYSTIVGMDMDVLGITKGLLNCHCHTIFTSKLTPETLY